MRERDGSVSMLWWKDLKTKAFSLEEGLRELVRCISIKRKYVIIIKWLREWLIEIIILRSGWKLVRKEVGLVIEKGRERECDWEFREVDESERDRFVKKRGLAG